MAIVQPTGARTYGTFMLGGTPAVAELHAHDVPKPGDAVQLSIDMNRTVLIDPQTQAVL